MNDQQSNKKNKKTPKIKASEILGSFETIGQKAEEIGKQATSELKNDLLKKLPQEALAQILGQRKMSGDLEPGESVEMQDVYTGKIEENKAIERHIHYERILLHQERAYKEKKAHQLRMELQAIIQEVQRLAQSTQGLAENLKVAAFQAPVEPGVYHIIFFQEILEFIQSFRKKIDSASVWLASANSRAQKKNYWSMYKKHKGSFLLSSEHYVARSAG